ncbi:MULTISPECIES: hypothetical protein [Acinetobacter]|uniref:hypothetical protein n=1 Tax=Acinetobacter TaxID=469 RepID=UPI00257B5ABF|nr:hypothetical protein [Acinetobacter sp. UBA5984]
MSNTDIKWFSFDNKNAPQLTNTWGCMIDVLDACLVTGFGSQPVSNLVIEDGVATATFGVAHNFKQFQVVEISGASESVLNGEFKILGLTANTIEFLVGAPNQISTGTISCRLASLGWTKEFSGSQKAVYRAKNIAKNPYYLRVDNSLDPAYVTTYAKFAKVGILETCSGIDDLSGNQAPFNSANPNKNWVGTGWFKWFYAAFNNVSPGNYNEQNTPDEGVRSWILIGNDKSFYLMPSFLPTTKSSVLKNTYAFTTIEKGVVSEAGVIATIKDTPVSSTLYFNSALNNLTNQAIATVKNIKGGLANTRFMSHLSPIGMYSGHVSNFTHDSRDGIIKAPLYVKDQDSNFAGELDLIKFLFYNASAGADYQTIHEDRAAFLMCRALFQANSSFGYQYGGWCFDLGVM